MVRGLFPALALILIANGLTESRKKIVYTNSVPFTEFFVFNLASSPRKWKLRGRRSASLYLSVNPGLIIPLAAPLLLPSAILANTAITANIIGNIGGATIGKLSGLLIGNVGGAAAGKLGGLVIGNVGGFAAGANAATAVEKAKEATGLKSLKSMAAGFGAGLSSAVAAGKLHQFKQILLKHAFAKKPLGWRPQHAHGYGYPSPPVHVGYGHDLPISRVMVMNTTANSTSSKIKKLS